MKRNRNRSPGHDFRSRILFHPRRAQPRDSFLTSVVDSNLTPVARLRYIPRPAKVMWASHLWLGSLHFCSATSAPYAGTDSSHSRTVVSLPAESARLPIQ